MTRLQIVFGFPHCCICEQRTCSPRSAFSSVTISILETSGKWNMVTDRPKSFFQHCVSTSMAETISLLYYDTLTCWLIVFWLCHSMKTNNLIITVVLPKISATKCNEFPYLWNSYFKDGNKISDHNQLPSSVSVYASSYPSSWYSKSLEKKATGLAYIYLLDFSSSLLHLKSYFESRWWSNSKKMFVYQFTAMNYLHSRFSLNYLDVKQKVP